MFALGALSCAAATALTTWLFRRSPQVGLAGLVAPVVLLCVGALCARKALDPSA